MGDRFGYELIVAT